MKNRALVPDEKDLSIGHAMRALTNKQRDFVRIFVAQGGRNASRAYAEAYPDSKSEKAHSVESHRLIHSNHIILAIREEADKRIRTGALLGASVLMEIADNPMHKDQLKAATELLNRSGLIVATQHHVVVEDKRTEKEIRDTILRLAEKNKIDVDGILGKDDAVDVEFEEVSSDGLEDLL